MKLIKHELQPNIITVEDPVEFIHKDSKSIVSHREVGKQTQSFAAALKAALREDPDVICSWRDERFGNCKFSINSC